jgi:capsular polysaccharide export protein
VPEQPLAPSSGTCHAVGFSWRKRQLLRAFLGSATRLRVAHAVDQLPAGSRVYVWGSRAVPRLPRDVELVRVEDGFLRSSGLGAAFAKPQSWVFDSRGLYYDARQPSDLECLLQQRCFDATLLARAAALRSRILGARITKYNLTGQAWVRGSRQARVCLVVGQVESDASLAHGAPGIRTNLDLLRQVRSQQPDAHLLYRPHPDVSTGLRSPGGEEWQAHEECDELVAGYDIVSLLEQVDEVHVLTSLTGFEALLRGRPVVTHGQPFYSGWGLTTDILPNPRRTRRLSLDELVAGALLCYPQYLSVRSGQPCSAEDVLDELAASRQSTQPLRRWQNLLGVHAGISLRRLGLLR